MLPLHLMKDQWGKTSNCKGKVILAPVWVWGRVLKFAYSLFGSLWRISMNHEGFDHFRDWVFWIFIASTHRTGLQENRTEQLVGACSLYKRRALFLSLSYVWLFAAPRTAASQAPLSFTVSWSSLKFMSIESMIPSNHLILCRPLFLPAFNLSQHQGFFSVSQLFTSGGQRTEASASASVLLMNIKCWFPWGLTGWTSLLSKELSRVFSGITVWKHQCFSTQCLYCPTLTSIYGYWKNHSFDYRSLPVARWYPAPVCEKTKFPASVIRMSQHSDSVGFQPPWQWEGTVNTMPWPDRISCWDDLIADYGGWDAGNKDLSVTWFSYRHLPAIVKEGTVPKRVYYETKPRVLEFFSSVKVLNFLWIKFMSRTLCDFFQIWFVLFC